MKLSSVSSNLFLLFQNILVILVSLTFHFNFRNNLLIFIKKILALIFTRIHTKLRSTDFLIMFTRKNWSGWNFNSDCCLPLLAGTMRQPFLDFLSSSMGTPGGVSGVKCESEYQPLYVCGPQRIQTSMLAFT